MVMIIICTLKVVLTTWPKSQLPLQPYSLYSTGSTQAINWYAYSRSIQLLLYDGPKPKLPI
jgi:hypothetical protein